MVKNKALNGSHTRSPEICLLKPATCPAATRSATTGTRTSEVAATKSPPAKQVFKTKTSTTSFIINKSATKLLLFDFNCFKLDNIVKKFRKCAKKKK